MSREVECEDCEGLGVDDRNRECERCDGDGFWYETTPAKVAGGHRAERPDGGDRAGSRDDAGSSQPTSPVRPVPTSSHGPRAGDAPKDVLLDLLAPLRPGEMVGVLLGRILIRDEFGFTGRGDTLQAAQAHLDAARIAYESDPARKG